MFDPVSRDSPTDKARMQELSVKALAAAIIVVVILAFVSLFIGVSDVSLSTLFGANSTDRAAEVLLISRIPRTLAIILAGMSMAVAGMIMQMLTRNRFVEPQQLARLNLQASAFCWLFYLHLTHRFSVRCWWRPSPLLQALPFF